MEANYLTPPEVAKRLGMSRSTIVRWVKQGIFSKVTKKNPLLPRSPWLIAESSVEEFEKTKKEFAPVQE